ncbi:TetR/AcrR family transcriptional regulator [Zobellia amurskyensis]|uniref:TetR/AcrR family transcriptional regulator n=1 Tax=Zobellia amurskyensis TaxID=248905 RepID=A0A7X3D1N9_9FLAO|nr:TetR/AcrR family transcriptional regulator [Zobellia amurskyensis]
MNKKDSILQSALGLLVEKGVHNTPMSAIAKNAGTGMGTIYNYFPTKDDLINELYVSIKEQEDTAFPDFDATRPIKTQFEAYLRNIILFFIDNAHYFMFMEQVRASPIITEESKNVGMATVLPVYDLINKGKEERIIKDIKTDELIQFMEGAVVSYLRWYHTQEHTDTSSIQNQVKMTWDAIKE